MPAKKKVAPKKTIKKVTKPKVTKKVVKEIKIKKENNLFKGCKIYDNYYFPKFIDNIVRRVNMNYNIYLQGATGVGKSELVNKLAQYNKIKLVRINFNIGITEQHLIGKFIIKDNKTEFIYGLVPQAMKNGWWILFDEIDFAQPEHLASLQSVLEGNSLLLTQNENEEIFPHPNFRVFATGNTKGRGDDTQSYVGTNFLNAAFLDRWSIFEMDYPAQENIIIDSILDDQRLSKDLISYFKILRKNEEQGEFVNINFSTRRLIQIAKLLKAGENLIDSLKFELFSRVEKVEQKLLMQLLFDIFQREHYLKGWKLGDAHTPELEPADNTFES